MTTAGGSNGWRAKDGVIKWGFHGRRLVIHRHYTHLRRTPSGFDQHFAEWSIMLAR
jgi:hypothetical protein